MQFVPTPVVLVTTAILLRAAIALLRQIRQHIRQLHAALPRDTGFRLRDVGTLSSWVAGVRPTARSPLAPLTLPLGCIPGFLRRCYRITFPRLDGRGIPGDVADQTVLLGLANQGLVEELRQFHPGKFFERPREGGFMRQRPLYVPSTQTAQVIVAVQSLQQLARGAESVHHFGDKSTSNGEAVL